MNEVDLAMQLIREGGRIPPFPWMELLRSHCVALAGMDPGVVSAISVTTRLANGSASEVEAVHRLSRLLGDEFGFTSTVWVNDRGLSVRFTRTPEPPAARPAEARNERRA